MASSFSCACTETGLSKPVIPRKPSTVSAAPHPWSIRRRESRGVARLINPFAGDLVCASSLLVISSPPQVAPSRRNTSTDGVNIALVLSYQRDLQIGGPRSEEHTSELQSPYDLV